MINMWPFLCIIRVQCKIHRLIFQHSPRIRIETPTRESMTKNGYSYDEISSHLTISSVERGDQGVYQCSATNHVGKSNDVKMDIYVHGTFKYHFLNLSNLGTLHSFTVDSKKPTFLVRCLTAMSVFTL